VIGDHAGRPAVDLRGRWRLRKRADPQRPPPLILLVPIVVGLLFLLLPLVGLLVRAPWTDMRRELSGQDAVLALRLSLETSILSTIVCVILGVPISFVLARVRFRGLRLIRALVTLPLVLPPVVGGVALFTAFGRTGVVGQWMYRWWGYSIPFSTTAVVLAQSFVAMPFLIIAVEGALRGADTRYEEAAATLGASRWTVFRRITLPLVAPGLAAGAVLCFARALGEFGATVTFAGNLPGTTQTMPVLINQVLQDDPQTAISLSLVLVAVSVVILVSLRGRWLGTSP
jgi:molybdate transport system permease protein